MKATKTIVPMSTMQLMRAELAQYIPAPEAEHVADSGVSLGEHVAMLIGSAPSKVLHFKDCVKLSYKLSEARRLAMQ